MKTRQASPQQHLNEWRRPRAWTLAQAGGTGGAIAEALDLTAGSVSQWLKRAHAGGVGALSHRLPRGATPRLTAAQRAQLPTLLAHGPELYGFRETCGPPGGWLPGSAKCSTSPVTQLPGLLLMLWDGAPIHRAQPVRAFLAQGAAARLQSESLPAYTPELNPSEGIWHYRKHIDLRNLCCEDLPELRPNWISRRSACATSPTSSRVASPSAVMRPDHVYDPTRE
jgi:hypothetical protein